MSRDLFNIFNDTEIENINTLINKLEESAFDYLKFESEEFKIVIGKNGMEDVVDGGSSEIITSAKDRVATAPEMEATDTRADADEAPVVSKTGREVQEQAGIIIIRAPTHGLFYSQAEPGAAPYVKVGGKVKKGDTVGLLEIMKVFNAIASEVSGEIVEIYVDDMSVVEPDQPLMAIKVE